MPFLCPFPIYSNFIQSKKSKSYLLQGFSLCNMVAISSYLQLNMVNLNKSENRVFSHTSSFSDSQQPHMLMATILYSMDTKHLLSLFHERNGKTLELFLHFLSPGFSLIFPLLVLSQRAISDICISRSSNLESPPGNILLLGILFYMHLSRGLFIPLQYFIFSISFTTLLMYICACIFKFPFSILSGAILNWYFRKPRRPH